MPAVFTSPPQAAKETRLSRLVQHIFVPSLASASVVSSSSSSDGSSNDVAGKDEEEGQAYFRVSNPNTWTAILEGLDVSLALDPEKGVKCRRALREALLEHPVLCLRNAAPLDRDTYMSLASVFGEIKLADEKLIFKRRKDPTLRPEDISPLNVLDSGTPGSEGTVNTRTTPIQWHTDDTYSGGPAMVTSLYAVKLPSSGGNTDFVNMQIAYETLEPELRARVEELSCIHSYARARLFKKNSKKVAKTDDTPRQGGRAAKTRPEEDIGDWAHPLVQLHPLTGKKSLYGVGTEGSDTKEVEGLADEDARDLIRNLLEHATAPEREVYSHVWRVNDMLLWDDLRVNHRANNDFPLGDPRVHHKLLIRTMKLGEDSKDLREVRIAGRKVS